MLRYFTVALLLATPAALADENVPLKPGPGLDVVQTSCSICHTLNYIRMNSVFLTQNDWKAEVTNGSGRADRRRHSGHHHQVPVGDLRSAAEVVTRRVVQ
jgi:mono/diheme cytochrome c family protein